jgi:hypothetical protein
MDAITLPEPPPLPPGPVPMSWEVGTEAGAAQERLHRLAVLHGACPRCADPPGGPTTAEWLAELARPQPADPARLRVGTWLTPEGELASFVRASLRVHDREAFEAWATDNFTPVGAAFAHVVTVDDVPWPRALFWFDPDGELEVEAASSDRYLHLEVLFEQLWPPVFRGFRMVAPLGKGPVARLDLGWPPPPAEATPFTRLERLGEPAAG